MHLLLILASTLTTVFLLELTSRLANHFKAKKSSLTWIMLVWFINIISTLVFIKYYPTHISTHLLVFIIIAFTSYLVILRLRFIPSFLLAIINIVVFIIVLQNLGLLNIDNKNISPKEVRLASDEICKCKDDEDCLINITPHMQNLIFESQFLSGNDAIESANAIKAASNCITPQRNIQTATLLKEWEENLKKNILVRDNSLLALQSIWSHIKGMIYKPEEESNENQNPIPSNPIQLSKIQDKEKDKLDTITKLVDEDMPITIKKKSPPKFKIIQPSELNEHIGDVIRLTKINGSIISGLLIAGKPNTVIVKQKLSGGYVQMPIPKKMVDLIEVKRRKAIQDQESIINYQLASKKTGTITTDARNEDEIEEEVEE
jgi:hypothetical protein